MKILVTGANGFIGKNLVHSLKDHEVMGIARDDLDLNNRTEVNRFFKYRSFDIVIHCAISGGRLQISDGPEVLWENLSMFYNLLNNKNKFTKLINIASGAELDRSQPIDLTNQDFKDKYPLDYYGMSKNIISRIVDSEKNMHNIRVFNVFGYNEDEQRMIKSSIKKYISKDKIIIHQDKLMDFFYIEDLILLINYYINNNAFPKDINAVYKTKYHLSEIAEMINNLSDYKVDIKIEQRGLSNSYIGKGMVTEMLPIEFKGLEKGITEIYNKLK